MLHSFPKHPFLFLKVLISKSAWICSIFSPETNDYLSASFFFLLFQYFINCWKWGYRRYFWLELLLKICNNTSAFSCSTHNSFITSASRYLFHKFQSMLSISFDWSSCKNKSIFLSACIWDFATDNWSYPYACLENSVLFLTCR